MENMELILISFTFIGAFYTAYADLVMIARSGLIPAESTIYIVSQDMSCPVPSYLLPATLRLVFFRCSRLFFRRNT